jgi:hypothetical protein
MIMGNPERLAIFAGGADNWNEWHLGNHATRPDFCGAKPSHEKPDTVEVINADLGADPSQTTLGEAHLSSTRLGRPELLWTHFISVDADLTRASARAEHIPLLPGAGLDR